MLVCVLHFNEKKLVVAIRGHCDTCSSKSCKWELGKYNLCSCILFPNGLIVSKSVHWKLKMHVLSTKSTLWHIWFFLEVTTGVRNMTDNFSGSWLCTEVSWSRQETCWYYRMLTAQPLNLNKAWILITWVSQDMLLNCTCSKNIGEFRLWD